MRKLTKEEFISRARAVHGDKYDYSKVIYVDMNTRVIITCPTHGDFEMQPNNHLSGQGCKKCGIEKRQNEKRLPTEEFIKKAKEKHGNKYDYSKAEYVNCDTKVCIICPEHGEFWQTPYHHVNEGCTCPKCAKNSTYTTEEYVEAAKKVHGDKYDYSRAEYINSGTKICIICPKHGEFWIRPVDHLRGRGCPKCVGKHKTTESFIEELKEIHGDKYDYSKVVYTGAFKPVRLICPKHGEFISNAHELLQGNGCPKCGREITSEKQRLTKEEFIKRARKVHGDKYDYSKVEYINAKTKVCVICPKHGDFYVTPNSHTSKHVGCPVCTESNLEREVRVFCENNNLKFTPQKKFEWLGQQRFDIYLDDYNIAIECQGYYHFEPFYNATGSTAEENLIGQIERDERKYNLARDNGVKLIYYIPSNLITKTKISNIYSPDNMIQNTIELKKYVFNK